MVSRTRSANPQLLSSSPSSEKVEEEEEDDEIGPQSMIDPQNN